MDCQLRSQSSLRPSGRLTHLLWIMGSYRAPVEDHLILPARVGLSAGESQSRRRSERVVPAPVSLRMLIDTGSNRTTLIPGILRHLAPQEGRDVQLITPSGPRTATLYWVRLDFPETSLASFEYLQVANLEMPASLAQFHGLIGRNVLRAWEEFRYWGRRGATGSATNQAPSVGFRAGCRACHAPSRGSGPNGGSDCPAARLRKDFVMASSSLGTSARGAVA